MKLIISIAICILRLRVECQSFFGPYQQYSNPFYEQFQKYNQLLNQQYNQQDSQQYNQQDNQQDNQQYNQQGNQQLNQQYNQQDNQQDNQQYNQQGNQRLNQQYNQQDNQQYGQQYNQQFTENSGAAYPTTKAQNTTPYFNYPTTVNNPTPTAQFRSNNLQGTDRNRYLQGITRNDQLPAQQFQNRQTAGVNDRNLFQQSNGQQTSTPFVENSSPNYYLTQQNNAAFSPLTTQPDSFEGLQPQAVADPNTIKNLVSNAVSNFGLNLMKIASQYNPGNVIVSPTSIAIVLALLQQGAIGEAQQQVTNALTMPPEASKTVFGVITANMTKRNSHNILSIANSMYVSDTFELNNNFKSLAIRSFGSEVKKANFARPLSAIQEMNSWVGSKTNYKITNLLAPGAVSPSTQLVLLNAVYFKGLWENKFKPEYTKPDTFRLSNGQKKMVPFMHLRHNFQGGYDPRTQALVTILPFEGHQYSLILILPKPTDTVNNVLSTITAEQLLEYQTFLTNEISVDIPKFTLKTDTDLNLVLKSMGITNIFSSKSELNNIGLYRTNPPQFSTAVHSGYLSIDEQGVTASAATAFAAIALSYDESSITFRADRPFIAVLWDNQLSIPIFISKIEDPS